MIIRPSHADAAPRDPARHMRRPGVSLPPTLTAAADATAHAPHAGATCLLPRLHALMLPLHQLL